ncbi:hypothetical protein EMCRGX_G018077 [Ephydatia muelleri]
MALDPYKRHPCAAESESDNFRKSSMEEEFQRALQEFLMQFRRTPLSSGYSPSELLNGRQIRSKIDTLLPSPAHIAQGKQAREAIKSQLQEDDSAPSVNKLTYSFPGGAPCYALYYGPIRDKDPRWVPAIVIKVFGPRSVNVRVFPKGLIWRRHIEQLQPRYGAQEDVDPGETPTVSQHSPQPVLPEEPTQGTPQDQSVAETQPKKTYRNPRFPIGDERLFGTLGTRAVTIVIIEVIVNGLNKCWRLELWFTKTSPCIAYVLFDLYSGQVLCEGISSLCQRSNNLFNKIWNVNQRSSSKLLTTRRERKGKESHFSFQPPGVAGIAMPAFIANTSAEPIAMFEIPAFCNRDFHSSSLSVSTSFSIRADDSPPLMMLLTVCISAHLAFTVLEQAAVTENSALDVCRRTAVLDLVPPLTK